MTRLFSSLSCGARLLSLFYRGSRVLNWKTRREITLEKCWTLQERRNHLTSQNQLRATFKNPPPHVWDVSQVALDFWKSILDVWSISRLSTGFNWVWQHFKWSKMEYRNWMVQVIFCHILMTNNRELPKWSEKTWEKWGQSLLIYEYR